MSDSPFVGPRPFEKEDSDRFYGRTRETEELLSLIIAHRAVLVYAQSGAGKSSLLRAGVIKRLEEQQYQVLRSARVHGLLPNDVPPESVQNIFVYHALQYWAAKLPSGQSIKDHAKTTLSEFLKPLAIPPEAGDDGPTPLIVIFDQFEEFFTTNADRWQERRPFFDQLAQALQDLPTMKVVFVMREEYIAQLEPFADLLPEKLRPRMHLERLRGNAARSAVVKPFQQWGLSFDPSAADELMKELSEIRVAEGDKVRKTGGEFVEPVQLQVVCQSLWENLPADWKNGPSPSTDSPRLITPEYIERFGDVNNALATYYDRAVKRAAAVSNGRIGEGELRRWFATALITPTGIRGLAFRGMRGTPLRIPGLALKELEDAHVIRREDRSGTTTHELTHDRFIEPIQKSNEKWLARYQDAERIRAKLEEYIKRDSDEPLDEVELREAEQYLNSPEARILGATPAARQLVKRSRKELDEAKKRQAEELEKALERAREQEQLRKAESERVKLLRRQRNFGVIVLVLGLIILLAGAAFYFVLNEQVQEVVEKGHSFREKAKADLHDEKNPIYHVNALRNLAIALNLNRKDTEAAMLARDLLLGRVWCPPVAPEVRYEQDTVLAAAFAPGGNNDKIFAVAGDGQLLFWNAGPDLSRVRSLFEKPTADLKHVVQPGFASFSPNAQWLFIIPPTLGLAANAEAAGPGPLQQTAGGGGPAGSGDETCKLQVWRWSPQQWRYEPAENLEFQRLRGSRMINFSWSPESDRVVLINTRLNETKCVFLEVNGDMFQELRDNSSKLTNMKIVALAFAALRSGIAAVSVDPVKSALRNVSFIDADDLEVVPETHSIQLSEGFQPNVVAFGPGTDQLTLTSWSGVRTLDVREGTVSSVAQPTFRDQLIRILPGRRRITTRLVVISLYGRVEIQEVTLSDDVSARKIQSPAEPVAFRGSIGIPQFSADEQRLLILSGGLWNVLDRMRLVDISPLSRTRKNGLGKFEAKPAPLWLADIASAVSALDTSGDGSLLTLETVKKRYPESKAGDPYEAVWKRFFPDER